MILQVNEEQIVQLPVEQFYNTSSTSGNIAHVYKKHYKRVGSLNLYQTKKKEEDIELNLKLKYSFKVNKRNYLLETEFKNSNTVHKEKFNTVKKETLNWKEFFSPEVIELSDISSLNLSSSSMLSNCELE